MSKYSAEFYEEMKESSLRSARAVVAEVLKFVNPASVIDVGCGRGNWLLAFKEAGVSDILGIDGDWVERDKLVIPEENFKAIALDKPFRLGRTADLALSLEVAEHLPDVSADGFVDNLISLAPVILFSAAIPFQGGSGHVNEQWPKYWDDKFRARGYVPVDALRRRVWSNERVSFFYAQNILFYVRKDALASYPAFRSEIEQGHGEALALVHPHMYSYYATRWRTLVPFLGKLPPWSLRWAKNMLGLFRTSRKGSYHL